MTNIKLLVRTKPGGEWEALAPREAHTGIDVADLLGWDLAPALDLPQSTLVVARRPRLASGIVDALALTAQGEVAIVATPTMPEATAVIAKLLAHAASLQTLTWDELVALCDVPREFNESLAAYIHTRSDTASWDAERYEHQVVQTLAAGRLSLFVIVDHATPTLLAPMRFLATTAQLNCQCFELQSLESPGVEAISVQRVDRDATGDADATSSTYDRVDAALPQATRVSAHDTAPQRSEPIADALELPVEPAPEPVPLDPSLAAIVQALSAVAGERTGRLAVQLHDFCVERFDTVTFGPAPHAAPTSESDDDAKGEQDNRTVLFARLDGASARDDETAPAPLMLFDDGTVQLNFGALALLDPSTTARAELVRGIERLLVTDLGNPLKIEALNLQLREHMNDATLMERFTEIVGDALDALELPEGSDESSDAAPSEAESTMSADSADVSSEAPSQAANNSQS